MIEKLLLLAAGLSLTVALAAPAGAQYATPTTTTTAPTTSTAPSGPPTTTPGVTTDPVVPSTVEPAPPTTDDSQTGAGNLGRPGAGAGAGASGTGGGPLADTGGDFEPLVRMGSALVVLGGAVALTAGKRRRSER